MAYFKDLYITPYYTSIALRPDGLLQGLVYNTLLYKHSVEA
jgi:hypothetical protein